MSLEKFQKDQLRKEIIEESKMLAENQELVEESLSLAASGLHEFNRQLQEYDAEC